MLLKTAQRWSGHRSLSVLLDTYMGVMKDDAAISLTRISGVYDEAAKTFPVTAGDGPDGKRRPANGSARGAAGSIRASKATIAQLLER